MENTTKIIFKGLVLLLIFFFLIWVRGCGSEVKPNPQKPNHDSLYKSEHKDNEIIKEAIRKDSVLTVTKIKYVVRYKTVYDSLYVTDTLCQQSLITLYNATVNLNNANDSIIANKDTLIKTLFHKIATKQSRIGIDSSYIVRLTDSILKVKRKGFVKGLKTGLATGVLLSGAVYVGTLVKP